MRHLNTCLEITLTVVQDIARRLVLDYICITNDYWLRVGVDVVRKNKLPRLGLVCGLVQPNRRAKLARSLLHFHIEVGFDGM